MIIETVVNVGGVVAVYVVDLVIVSVGFVVVVVCGVEAVYGVGPIVIVVDRSSPDG